MFLIFCKDVYTCDGAFMFFDTLPAPFAIDWLRLQETTETDWSSFWKFVRSRLLMCALRHLIVSSWSLVSLWWADSFSF